VPGAGDRLDPDQHLVGVIGGDHIGKDGDQDQERQNGQPSDSVALPEDAPEG
jgi:hypothetical protein